MDGRRSSRPMRRIRRHRHVEGESLKVAHAAPTTAGGWPPRWEDTFEHGPDRPVVDAYSLQVHQELEARAPFFGALSDDQQVSLARILYTLDSFASAAAKEVRGSPWAAEALRTLEPPVSLTSGREINRWRSCQANQLCVDACWRARQAILAGDWITAVEFAMVAGNRALGDLASSAFRSQKPLLDKEQRTARHDKTARRDAAIREQAQKIWASHPKLSAVAVANSIKADGKIGKELSAQSIRKIIGADAKVGKTRPA